MKGTWKKAVALTVALSIAAAPVLAQRGKTVGEAMRKGDMDGRRDTNTMLWMGAGFFFGLLGVGAAYMLEPNPPYGRTAGKSEEYRAAYTDAYRMAGKAAQTSAAIKGCVVGTLLYVATYTCCWIIWAPSWYWY